MSFNDPSEDSLALINNEDNELCNISFAKDGDLKNNIAQFRQTPIRGFQQDTRPSEDSKNPSAFAPPTRTTLHEVSLGEVETNKETIQRPPESPMDSLEPNRAGATSSFAETPRGRSTDSPQLRNPANAAQDDGWCSEFLEDMKKKDMPERALLDDKENFLEKPSDSETDGEFIHTCGKINSANGENVITKKEGRRRREDRKLERYNNQTPKTIFNNTNINRSNNTELLDMQAFEDQIYLAKEYFQRGEYKSSLEYWTEILEQQNVKGYRSDQLPYTYKYIGICKNHLKDYKGAINCLIKALDYYNSYSLDDNELKASL